MRRRVGGPARDGTRPAGRQELGHASARCCGLVGGMALGHDRPGRLPAATEADGGGPEAAREGVARAGPPRVRQLLPAADHGQAPGGRDCGRIQLTRPRRAGGSRCQPSPPVARAFPPVHTRLRIGLISTAGVSVGDRRSEVLDTGEGAPILPRPRRISEGSANAVRGAAMRPERPPPRPGGAGAGYRTGRRRAISGRSFWAAIVSTATIASRTKETFRVRLSGRTRV